MADITVRQLDDYVADVLRARAQYKGISLEEEGRQTLAASVDSEREAFARRAAAVRADSGNKPGDPALDSARIIREERDAWG